ncbi:MAG: diacylglycerol kinase [Limnobacter sp.]|nr:diacylglycerol kinase [Limnobacter sp.]
MAIKPNLNGIGRIVKAAKYSWEGLKSSWLTEAAVRQEVLALVVLVPLACWLQVSTAERALLLLSLFLVLVVELLNTAIETTINRIGPEHHALSKKAKDTGSAAVLIAILAALVVWLVVLVF